jgi:hypothetical protein
MRAALALILTLLAGPALAQVDNRPYWEREPVTPEEGCHYGIGTDCSSFCVSPKTHWSIEIQGCIPDVPEGHP